MKSAKKGAYAEEAVARQLRLRGFKMVRKIANNWRVLRHLGNGQLAVVPNKKVEGDFRAIWPYSGQSVLVEVKAREDKLSLSDFDQAQIENLNEHVESRGLSIVAWVEGSDIHLMKWPISKRVLKKGRRMTADEAKRESRKLDDAIGPPF